MDTGGLASELRQLKGLQAEGILTEHEFEIAKVRQCPRFYWKQKKNNTQATTGACESSIESCAIVWAQGRVLGQGLEFGRGSIGGEMVSPGRTPAPVGLGGGYSYQQRGRSPTRMSVASSQSTVAMSARLQARQQRRRLGAGSTGYGGGAAAGARSPVGSVVPPTNLDQLMDSLTATHRQLLMPAPRAVVMDGADPEAAAALLGGETTLVGAGPP